MRTRWMLRCDSCPGRGAAFFMPLRRAGTVPNTGVMAGLDPAIHLEKRVFAQMMDARAKPRMTKYEFATTAALQRTASQGLRAALRPGNANIESHLNERHLP